MRIAILGATGSSGLQLVAQAVQRGHNVSAIVRNPDKLSLFTSNDNLKIVKCDILNPKELATNLTGMDCVLSALGVAGIRFWKTQFYLDSMKSIIAAMRESNVKRLICMTSQYAKPGLNYPLIYTLLLRPLIGRQLDSMWEMEQFLFNECDEIDYTIVRPPGLNDNLLCDKRPEVKINEYFFGSTPTMHQMPRADVAKFMLDELDKNEFIKKGIAIDYLK